MHTHTYTYRGEYISFTRDETKGDKGRRENGDGYDCNFDSLS